MKEGKLIENNHTQLILQSPKKKYTKGLLSININNKKRVKKLNTLQNFEKEIQNNNISKRTRNNRLKLLYEKEPLMIVRNVSKYYSRFVNFRKKVNFKALKNINIKLYEGETLGIIGESGSGKTTLSEVIMKIKKYEFGNIFYKNKNINKFNKAEMLNYRKEVQIVFQDPYSSLNPLFNVKEIIAEPIKCHNIFEKKSEIDKKCKELINDVKIGQSYLNKYPHELSGGQRQRVAIARAISINPKILILDESVSALDVSIQASILNLLTEIKEKYNLSYIFISHDLSVVKHMSDKIAVFLNGKIVEYADADLLFKDPKKEYTKALLRSAIN
jgi:peptide/nickel transport system ATP-binding protein